MKTRKIGLVNYLAYGSGDFLGAGTTALTAAWLLYFYTTFCEFFGYFNPFFSRINFFFRCIRNLCYNLCCVIMDLVFCFIIPFIDGRCYFFIVNLL